MSKNHEILCSWRSNKGNLPCRFQKTWKGKIGTGARHRTYVQSGHLGDSHASSEVFLYVQLVTEGILIDMTSSRRVDKLRLDVGLHGMGATSRSLVGFICRRYDQSARGSHQGIRPACDYWWSQWSNAHYHDHKIAKEISVPKHRTCPRLSSKVKSLKYHATANITMLCQHFYTELASTIGVLDFTG